MPHTRRHLHNFHLWRVRQGRFSVNPEMLRSVPISALINRRDMLRILARSAQIFNTLHSHFSVVVERFSVYDFSK